MKTILLLSTLLTSTTAVAQQSIALLCDSLVTTHATRDIYQTATYAYDERGNRTEVCYYDQVDGTLRPSSSNQTFYDEHDRPTSRIYYTYSRGESIEIGLEEYTYDEHGNNTCHTTYNRQFSQWIESKRTEMTYDEHDNMLCELQSEWFNGDWQPSHRTENTYDASGHLIQAIHSRHDYLGWFEYLKFEYSNDDQGNPTSYIYYTRHDADSEFVAVELAESTFNTFGSYLTTTYYLNVDGQWQNSERSEFTYDDHNNRTCFKQYEWDGEQWVIFSQVDYTYNDLDMSLTLYYYNVVDGAMTGTYRYKYYYSEHILSLPSLNSDLHIHNARKVLRDGHLLIEVGDCCYRPDGCAVKAMQ